MNLDEYSLTQLRRSPLFRALDEERFAHMVSTARVYELGEGEILFRQGEPLREIFINVRGFLKLYRLTPNGDEKVVDIIRPGSSFAEAVLFMGGAAYPVNAVAQRAATVVGVNAREYEEMLRGSADLCFSLMGLMSQRMHWLLNEVDRLSLHNATFRLAAWLLESRGTCVDRCRIELGVPKHVVASRLSIKPETFSRILKRLAERGLIAVGDQHIELLDIDALEKLVDIEV